MVDPAGIIFQRKEISGWYKVPTAHQAALLYTDATMIYNGSLLAISAAPPLPGLPQLHLLATPSGPTDVINPNLAWPVSVATLLDGSVLVLTAVGTLHHALSARGPWQQIALPPGLAPIDVAVTPDGHVLCLDPAGAIHQAPARGAPAPNAAWAVMPAPGLANVRRIEFLRDGSLIALDNANAAHLLPAGQINANGVWQALQHVGPILSVTPLGGHTLLAIDPADNRFMTADALPENWVQVANQPPVPVRALAHLRTGHVAALGNDNLIYRAPYAPAGPGGPPVIGAFAQYTTIATPVPAIGMTANPNGKIIVVGNDRQLYTWETASIPFQPPPPRWSHLNTGPTHLCSGHRPRGRLHPVRHRPESDRSAHLSAGPDLRPRRHCHLGGD